MKIHDLSQPLNQDTPFWPFYPPFEVKYFKRKSEHGVNAQYIQTSNHMGTHLDAPRHFVTGGRTIDQIPLEWLYGPGVIVDISDEMSELEIFTPEMLDAKADIREGDILFIHTGWSKHAQFGSEPDEEKYIPEASRPALRHCALVAGEEDSRLGCRYDFDRPPHELAHRSFSGQGWIGTLAKGTCSGGREVWCGQD